MVILTAQFRLCYDNNTIESIVPPRNTGCLWVLSTSVYQLLRTSVHSIFYPLPWPQFIPSSTCFLDLSSFHLLPASLTSVHSIFYPLPWLPIFSSYFSVFLSSCFPEGSKVGQPLVSLHPLFLMCDQSIQIFFFLFLHLYLLVLLLSIDLCWK